MVVTNWESEAKALQQMNQLKQKHIVRFITAFRRGQRGEEDYYLIFEWADGGNLRDLWMQTANPALSARLIKEAIRQLLRLAQALCAAHNLSETGASFRHGDLKPENILCFKSDTEFGTLKIGDWGLAKHHNIVTQERPQKTTTRHGTLRYEPPEVVIGIPPLEGQAKDRLSRLYDIWAMGCVTLEFLIWLLYGYDELTRFNLNINGEALDDGPCYQIEIENGERMAKVHRLWVFGWIIWLKIRNAQELPRWATSSLLSGQGCLWSHYRHGWGVCH
jgi:serine/threonine protein kinase